MKIALGQLTLDSETYRGVSVPTMVAEHIDREMHGTEDGVRLQTIADSRMDEDHIWLDRRQVALLVGWLLRWQKESQ